MHGVNKLVRDCVFYTLLLVVCWCLSGRLRRGKYMTALCGS